MKISLDTLTALAWTLLVAVCALGIGNSPTLLAQTLLVPNLNSASQAIPPSPLIMPAAQNLTANWQNAGLAKIGGIPGSRTVCTTISPTGTAPTDGNAISSAISGCAANTVIVLNNGIWAVTQSQWPMQVGKSITLRGAGSPNTSCSANFDGSNACWGTVITTIDGPVPTYNPTAQCGSPSAISSYTYNSGTGVVTLTMAATVGFSSGAVYVNGLNIPNVNNGNGIGSSAGINSWTVTSAAGTTVTYTAATGLSGTPSGGGTLYKLSNCANAGGMFTAGANFIFDYGWSGCAAAAGNCNPTTANAGTTLTADAAQGDLTVHVTSVANFSVGDVVLIDEDPQMVSTTNPMIGQAAIQASPEFLNSTNTAVMKMANPDTFNCSSGLDTYSLCTNRNNEELHVISSINSGALTITFDSPLTLAFRQSGGHDARLYWPTHQSGTTKTPFIQQVGFENMTILRGNGDGISFKFCLYCWDSNVEIAWWINGAINDNYALRSYHTGGYYHHCIDCQNNGAEYPIGISTASTEVLVDNCIVQLGGKGMVGRAAGAAVISGCYFDKTFYELNGGIGNYWNDMAANGSHFGGTHGFLFEGNWTNNCDGDETHGNAIFHVFYRNQCRAYRSPFTDPSTGKSVDDCAGIGWNQSNTAQSPGPLRAFGPMGMNYWYVFAGNVGGQAGMQSCAGGSWVYGGGTTFANRAIWRSGWTGSEWSNLTDSYIDGVNGRYIFKNCNFDYVNVSVVDCAGGFSPPTQNSFYLPSGGASPPSWWPSGSTTYPYPWIDSASGTPVKTNSLGGSGLPAKARADAGNYMGPQP